MELHMEVEIISEETIKPSSSKLSDLTTLRLSLLDQLSPPIYVPLILYYPMNAAVDLEKIKKVAARLKVSLSITLSHFYPLAGRIKDPFSIDCNNEGILFRQANVSCNFSEFLEKPRTDSLEKFLPCPIFSNEPDNSKVHVAVQLNVFASGSGIAIGLCFLHKLVDAASMAAFLKCWAASARDEDDKAALLSSDVDFEAASRLFTPSKEVPSGNQFLLSEDWPLKAVKAVCKRFVFDATAISRLKAEVTSELLSNPSRVMIVSGFIWKCTMAVSKNPTSPSVLTFAVDMRRRMVPPLSPNCIGNMVWQAMASTTPGEKDELRHLVCLMRAALAKINHDHTKSLQGETGLAGVSKLKEELKEMQSRGNRGGGPDNTVSLMNSWCGFGFNEVDFGWGKPIWVSNVGGQYDYLAVNIVVLMENGVGGEEIEAWITLAEHEMSILEHDPEFRSFASLNPSITA
ncbi:hypothetical protein RJ639_047118 [Escallonia herrerae]|uniref:Uncharacterized protein n=1 Tax=Escallonia herrerae TaxID=1293975 RepID=A0AA88W6Z4_9ASTE|nr:hypothetical protein RJ639_047118 [Escallonia herrerae]